MLRRVSILLFVVLLLAALPAGLASAQEMSPLDLPSGIAAQAEPLLTAMMERMQQMGMSPEQMQMMMSEMQAMAEQLPPGTFLELLKLMPELDVAEMMALHEQIHQEDLLQQSPGQVLVFVQQLAG